METAPLAQNNVLPLVRRLLGRGARILGLSALAHARGHQAGFGPWHVLSKEIVAGAEEVLCVLERGVNPVVLETSIQAAMAQGPAVSAPSWTKPLWQEESALSRIGARLETKMLIPALGPHSREPSLRVKGLAALAIALSRSPDSLAAVAKSLREEERRDLVRMGYLAQVTVDPGVPSKMKRALRQWLKEETNT